MTSAQTPKHAQMHNSAGMPIMTKAKFGAIGVELSPINNRGIPIAAQMGQSPLVGDVLAVSTMGGLSHALYRKAKGVLSRVHRPSEPQLLLPAYRKGYTLTVEEAR